MARSCGIRIGPRRYELIVLDGSLKKHRVAAYEAGEFPGEVDDPAAEAASILKKAAKTHSIPLDTVGIAVDAGLAAFRDLSLPFQDEAKVGQVIKFEIESQLPQWNIDDVIVDFLPQAASGDDTKLLVSAVPKADLKAVLSLCERAGIEPLEAELETTAMVNAALAADLCHADDAQVLVHIGEGSTSVVVTDGRQVRSMRAIHMGALPQQAPEAPETSAAPEAEEENDGDAPTPPPVDPELARRRLEQAVSRIRRELGRTVSGARTLHPIEAIYVCGLELPGLVGETVLDVPVYLLDAFEEDSGQPAEGTAPLVVAYGVALRHLGGNGSMVPASLRREELRFTGTMERLELPLAIACLLLATLAAVFWIFEDFRFDRQQTKAFQWLMSTVNYMQGQPAQHTRGRLEHVAELPKLEKLAAAIEADYKLRANENVRPEVSPLVRFDDLTAMLEDANRELSKKLGQDAGIQQPQSALEGLTLVVGVLAELGPAGVGRFSIRRAFAEYQRGRGGKLDTLRVELDLTFFAPDALVATSHWETFRRKLEQMPWYEDISHPRTETLGEATGQSGIFVNRFAITLDLSRVERGIS